MVKECRKTIDLRSHHGAVVASNRLGDVQAYLGKGWTRFAVRRISSISILDCFFQVIDADIHRVVSSPKIFKNIKDTIILWAPARYCLYIYIYIFFLYIHNIHNMHNIHNLPTIFHLFQPPLRNKSKFKCLAFCCLN